MISGLDADKFDRETSIVDRIDVDINEQNKKNNKYEERQEKRNKIIVGFITGIILYMIIMTVLFFNSQSKLKVYSSPKSMDVIMYDRDNKKEIHYSAYVKINTDKGTVELQETRKEDEIDISNKVE